MKHYRLGINLDLKLDGEIRTWEERLLAAKRAGFEAFFVCWDDQEGISEQCRALAALAKQEHMIFHGIHAPWVGVDTLWEPEEKTEYVVQKQIDCVRLCAELNVPTMIIHPYIGFDREYRPTKEGIQNYARIVAVAEELGVKLAFENVEGEVYLAEIFKQLGDSPAVGLCWDTGHAQCYNEGRDIPGLYANGKLFFTHFNDNLGRTGEGYTWKDDAHLLPYDGIVNWNGVMKRLEKAGYEGDVLMFELTAKSKPGRETHKKYEGMSFEEFIAECYARAKRVAEEVY